MHEEVQSDHLWNPPQPKAKEAFYNDFYWEISQLVLGKLIKKTSLHSNYLAIVGALGFLGSLLGFWFKNQGNPLRPRREMYPLLHHGPSAPALE